MMKIHAWRAAFLAAGVLVCLGILLAGCKSEKEPTKQVVKPMDVMVTTAPVENRKVVYTLEQVGDLRSGEEAMLRAQAAGAVAEMLFKQGSDVKKGDVLVRLDDAKTRAEIRNLQARIDQLKVRLAFQEKTLGRNRTLLKRSAIPQQQFDQLASEVKETELAISQVRADLARQMEMLTETVIRAPFSGVVGAKIISLGDYLKVGDQVVRVVKLDPLEIGFNVPERYKSKLSPGQEVKLKVASEPDSIFQGVIFFISPTVDVKTRTFLVKARVGNKERRLNPGMFARVSLVTDVHPGASVVPWNSVIQTENETYIYLARDGKAVKLSITLGKTTSQWAEVLKPVLKAGEAVIVEGKYAARDKGNIRVQENKAQTTNK